MTSHSTTKNIKKSIITVGIVAKRTLRLRIGGQTYTEIKYKRRMEGIGINQVDIRIRNINISENGKDKI
jgi:hypothetical protein